MGRPRSTFKGSRAKRHAKLVNSEYRSKLEQRVAGQLEKAGVSFAYEKYPISYTVPAREARYTSDFFPSVSNIILECKGWFEDATERAKYILIKQQYPLIDLRFIFQDASKPIYKGSPTTMGAWATANGFLWADEDDIPKSWFKEMKDQKSGT